MAIVATYTSANCPGMPDGCIVRVDDSELAKDQAAAWDKAYAVAFRIRRDQLLRDRMNANGIAPKEEQA